MNYMGRDVRSGREGSYSDGEDETGQATGRTFHTRHATTLVIIIIFVSFHKCVY
jgi:hypothetical protein